VYILGGQKQIADTQYKLEFHRDLWCLDLRKLDKWEQLPSYPDDTIEVLRGLNAAVHEDKAYVFTGRPRVDFFDMITGQWGSIMTSFTRKDRKPGAGSWLYPGNDITDFTVQIVKGKLYVFGGRHLNAAIGSNLLVVLDFATRQWTRLSGTVEPRQDYSCPGPRKWPASWVNKEGDRLYILFGVADRVHAQREG
jgi:hypothetical protein